MTERQTLEDSEREVASCLLADGDRLADREREIWGVRQTFRVRERDRLVGIERKG